MNQNFSIKGMSLTSPIHASLLVLTTPIVITLLAAFVLKEKLTSLQNKLSEDPFGWRVKVEKHILETA